MRGQDARRAAIIGGSMAGLFAGLRLRKAGWAVDIYERSRTELAGRGAGINTHPELISALAAVDLRTGDDIGVMTGWRRLLDGDGSVLLERPYEQVSTSWDKLLGILRRGFGTAGYHLGRSVTALREEERGIEIAFADGARARADLVVGADGFRSTARSLLWPVVQPRYAGYVAWRGMMAEKDLSPEAHRLLFDAFVMSLPEHEEILGYPVAGPGDDIRPGRRRFNVVWYRPADESGELPRLLTDASGSRHELSIPPPLIAPAVIGEMREAARRKLPPALAEVMLKTEHPFLQPIYDVESERMTSGRCALVGDAAFVARPHVGAGVTKAAEDALALGTALEREPDVATALARFEAERLPVNRRILEKTRWLGRALRRNEGPAPAPEEILRDTASLDWMRGDGSGSASFSNESLRRRTIPAETSHMEAGARPDRRERS